MQRSRAVHLATALVIGLFGLYFLGAGAWLVTLGGSPYYVIVGAALVASAALLAFGRAGGLWLYALVLAGTLGWALWEVGFETWGLIARGDILVVIGAWLLLPFIWRSLRGGLAAATLAVVVLVCAAAILYALTLDPYRIRGEASTAQAQAPAPSGENISGADWVAYGGTNYGDRFSSLNQITPANVSKLELAWQFQTGDTKGPDDPVEFTNEATPLKIGDTLYTCSPHQIVFALDAAKGTLRWKFDPHIKPSPFFQHMTCRGVAYHHTQPGATASDGTPAPAECPDRIFLPTNDARLFALDAHTGQPCAGFGDNGVLDLKVNEPVTETGRYEGTSPPLATDKILIVGGAVIDNYSNKVPSGAIRGFDIYSGKLVWVFDSGNPDPNEMPSETHTLSMGSPNEWAPAAADEKLGLAYIPLGSSSPDIWAGPSVRTPDEERWDSALVALDIATGKLRWSFQNVHHDLWDMDVPSQPSLVDVTTANGTVPAIYAPAKTGNIFVLDRRDGHLIVPAPETPVPQGAAPGDHVSPTQPFSDLSFRPKEKLSGRDMWGATPVDQLICRLKFRNLRYDGPFTPPSEQGTLVFPGDFGMFEWGGISVDPRRQVAMANPMSMPFVSQLIPRGPNNPAAPNSAHPPGSELGVQPMYGAPYGVKLGVFLSPFGIPCLKPPWGEMAAIDLKDNRVAWRHRIGTIQDMAPVPLPFDTGTPMLGGPMATAGGIAFETGTMDYFIRAFDVTNGHLLWQDRLPAGGQSTPMTYEVDGRQFVVTVDGGHGSFGTKLGDYVRAYALPAGG